MERYFEHYGLEPKVHKTKIGEKAKIIPIFLSIVDSMTEFLESIERFDLNLNFPLRRDKLTWASGTSSRCRGRTLH